MRDPHLDDGDVRLYQGEALEVLREMPSESVQMIMTSPPFWGLRSYIADDHADKPLEIGLEDTPDEWCARLVGVMREARRVLRSDGVCWIEVGDTYTAGQGGRQSNVGEMPAAPLAQDGGIGTGDAGSWQSGATSKMTPARGTTDLKPKDLVGAPWLLAFALRADGWYLRSDTIWARPNPMPESVTDRPTKGHSYVFLLTKSARYFYDADAIREPASNPLGPLLRTGVKSKIDPNEIEGHRNGKGRSSLGSNTGPSDRNARSVWSIPTEPTPFAHFATFPQALVERCIKAGTSEHGACSECGAPWRRITERIIGDRSDVLSPAQAATATGGKVRGASANQPGWRKMKPDQIVDRGWEWSCSCRASYLTSTSQLDHEGPSVVPCVVLDPFMGSGTTALVARRLGRHAIGIELNSSYLEISATRLQQLSLLGGAS